MNSVPLTRKEILYEYVKHHCLNTSDNPLLLDFQIQQHFKHFIDVNQTRDVLRELADGGYITRSPSHYLTRFGTPRYYISLNPDRPYLKNKSLVGRPGILTKFSKRAVKDLRKLLKIKPDIDYEGRLVVSDTQPVLQPVVRSERVTTKIPGQKQVVYDYIKAKTLTSPIPAKLLDREVALHFKKFIGIPQTEAIIKQLVRSGYLNAKASKETTHVGTRRCFISTNPEKEYVQTAKAASPKFTEAIEKYGLDELLGTNSDVVEEQVRVQADLPLAQEPEVVVEVAAKAVPIVGEVKKGGEVNFQTAPAKPTRRPILVLPKKQLKTEVFDKLFEVRPELKKVEQTEAPKPSMPEQKVSRIEETLVSPSSLVEDLQTLTGRSIELPLPKFTSGFDDEPFEDDGSVQVMVELPGGKTEMVSIKEVRRLYRNLRQLFEGR